MVDTNNSAIREELLELVLEVFNYGGKAEDIVQKSLIDIGADSLELVELATELEERFEMKVDLDALDSSTTISELLDLIQPSGD